MNRILVAALAAAVALAACKSEDAGKAKEQPSTTTEAARPAPDTKPAPTIPDRPTPTPPPQILLDPAKLTEKAPEKFKVRFETTEGPVVLELQRELAPNGVDRFFNLVKAGFFTDIAFFRAVENFVVQFGIHGNPQVSRIWRTAVFPDDPVKGSNERGTITFATSGPNSRTTQLFINLRDNKSLDGMGFAPIGKVVEGMDVVDKLYTGYGEGAPRGAGPSQGQIQMRGNDYLEESFPQLDYIRKATIVE